MRSLKILLGVNAVLEAIARGAGRLCSERLMDTAAASAPMAERRELLVGGPTQRRGPSRALRDFIDALPTGLLGVPVATFDTRYRGSTRLIASAAAEAAKVLRKAGGELVAPPESFFIARGGPLEHETLEAGQIERAEASGRAVGAALNGGSAS